MFLASDLLLFFVFYECMLLPAFALLLLYGGPNRMHADGTSPIIAASTCDGVADADAQADPDETAMSPIPTDRSLTPAD